MWSSSQRRWGVSAPRLPAPPPFPLVCTRHGVPGARASLHDSSDPGAWEAWGSGGIRTEEGGATGWRRLADC